MFEKGGRNFSVKYLIAKNDIREFEFSAKNVVEFMDSILEKCGAGLWFELMDADTKKILWEREG